MENSLKGLILAAGTVITCMVITLGFYLSKEAQATATTGTSQIGKINSEFAENDKVIYDGVKVSGNEVVNAIKKMQGQEVGVYVSTKETNTFYGHSFDLNSGDLEGRTNYTYESTLSAKSAEYINPYAMFHGSVVRNANDAITGICFIQE